jgi:FkbM family methyltransferase
MSGPSIGAKAARSLRFLGRVTGWRRLAQAIAGQSGSFVVTNDGIRFAGDMGSYIDRQIYLFGDYERDLIRLFLAACPRKGVILDIGANAGTHSLWFSRAFATVHAFEPNRLLWDQLCANLRLNQAANVELHRVGLSDAAGEFDMYDVANDNKGLATFATHEQYDLPLTRLHRARVEIFDDYLPDLRIDAVKIDVQGLEPNVLRGMRRTLDRDRPVVWAEFGAGTLAETCSRSQLERLFPYPIEIRKFTRRRRGPIWGAVSLTRYEDSAIGIGDYVISSVGREAA